MLEVEAHEVHVEVDHPFDPFRHLRETPRELRRKHVRAAVVETVDRDTGVLLVDPVARTLPHEEPLDTRVHLPPTAGVAVGPLRAEITRKEPSAAIVNSSRSCVVGPW